MEKMILTHWNRGALFSDKTISLYLVIVISIYILQVSNFLSIIPRGCSIISYQLYFLVISKLYPIIYILMKSQIPYKSYINSIKNSNHPRKIPDVSRDEGPGRLAQREDGQVWGSQREAGDLDDIWNHHFYRGNYGKMDEEWMNIALFSIIFPYYSWTILVHVFIIFPYNSWKHGHFGSCFHHFSRFLLKKWSFWFIVPSFFHICPTFFFFPDETMAIFPWPRRFSPGLCSSRHQWRRCSSAGAICRLNQRKKRDVGTVEASSHTWIKGYIYIYQYLYIYI